MSKKSFTENPALRFINPPPAGGPELANPAAPPPTASAVPPAAGPPLKPNPLYVETKSRRLQLLLQPSLHQGLKNRAQADGRSLNDLIHSILAEWLEKGE